MTKQLERQQVVNEAVRLHLKRELPIVVVMEKWAVGFARQGRPMSGATVLGMGAARGKWLAALELSRVPPTRVLQVYARTWQAPTLGGMAKSDVLKRRAHAYAKARWGVRTADDDEADALGLLAWSLQSAEVQALASKRARMQAMLAGVWLTDPEADPC